MIVQVEVVANSAGRFDYVITTSTGYRATMERCDRDACADGHLAACVRPLNEKHMHSTGSGSGSVDNWLKHSAKFCHGWHDGRIENFCRALRATRKPWRPFTAAEAIRRVPGGRWSMDRIAAELGWTAEDVKAEFAKAEM